MEIYRNTHLDQRKWQKYIFDTLLPVCEYDQRSACFHERPLAFFLLLTTDRATLSLSLRAAN